MEGEGGVPSNIHNEIFNKTLLSSHAILQNASPQLTHFRWWYLGWSEVCRQTEERTVKSLYNKLLFNGLL